MDEYKIDHQVKTLRPAEYMNAPETHPALKK